MAHLFAYFDESGKHKEHGIVGFGGFVDGFERWRAFTEDWARLLRDYELPSLHAVNALYYSTPLGRMGACKDADGRIEQMKPFVQAVTATLELGVSIAVDVKAYKKFTKLHKRYGTDPHYFAFFLVLNTILTHYGIPRKYQVGLICHDEQRKAMRCYKLLQKLKLRNPEFRERVPSICFSDDRGAPQLQCADLFAYLSRLEAQRVFKDRPYLYQPLFNSFFEPAPNGHVIGAHVQHFAEPHLEAAENDLLSSATIALRVRLPK